MKLFHKLGILYNSLVGYLIKYKIDLFGVGKIIPLNPKENKIVVSLTSYGRRVSNNVVFYTLVSLLKQTKRPSRIILWIDNSWNYESLPLKLKGLVKYGIEYKFCEDLRSYKKLIPTLGLYPNNIIITVDDDMYYNNNLVENLWEGYVSNGNIQCCIASYPIYDKAQHCFIPYNEWPAVSNKQKEELIIPIGVGGVLYPPNSLSDEVMQKNRFQELAPSADDLWFWVMAKRKGSRHSFKKSEKKNYSFDNLYQFLHKGSALTHSNAGENKNDVQLKKILEVYPIDI